MQYLLKSRKPFSKPNGFATKQECPNRLYNAMRPDARSFAGSLASRQNSGTGIDAMKNGSIYPMKNQSCFGIFGGNVVTYAIHRVTKSVIFETGLTGYFEKLEPVKPVKPVSKITGLAQTGLF